MVPALQKIRLISFLGVFFVSTALFAQAADDNTAGGEQAADAQNESAGADRDALYGIKTERKPGTSLDSAVLYETTHAEKRRQMIRTQLQEESERKYRYALELSASGNYNQAAARQFRDFLILYPDHDRAAEVRMELARIYMKSGQSSMAKQMLASVLRSVSDYRAARAMLLMARLERSEGRITQASDWLNKLKNQYPSTEEARRADLEMKSIRFLDSESDLRHSGGPDSAGSESDRYEPGYEPDRQESEVENRATESDPLDLMGEGIEETTNQP